VNFTDSIEYPPQGKKGLPPNWCNQCLACHPFQSKKGTYHVRTFKENLAMHQAISLGKLPKVDPWAELVKAFKPPSPKPAPAQAQQPQELCTGTWTASADTDRYFERFTQGLSPMDKVRAFSFFLRDEDRYQHQRRQSEMQGQQAPAAQSFGSYATAATTGGYSSYYPLPTGPRWQAPQPTGPPTKKKRKAGNTNEGSGRVNKGARFGGAHTAIMQEADNQRVNAAQTSQPTANPASNTIQRQRDSSNQFDNVQRTSQTESLRITNVPKTVTATKTPAKGEATAADQATDRKAAQKAADDEVIAKTAAPNDNKST
jgi:hypothetical protein